MTHNANVIDETLLMLDRRAIAADLASGEKIKRPMNAFMLWSKQRRREISKTDPTIHNAQISKLLGEEWKMLPTEQKQPFLKESQELMVQHKKEHPNYRYKPRKSKQDRSSGGASKPYDVLSPQFKSYVKYTSSGHQYPSPAIKMYLDKEPPHFSSSPPLSSPPSMYYKAYRECRIPGCYECEYQRPSYRHHHSPPPPPPPKYFCKDDVTKYESNYTEIKQHRHQPRCHCCSTPPSSYISCHNRQSFRSPTTKQRSNSFTVESLMKEYTSPTQNYHYYYQNNRSQTISRPPSASSSSFSPVSPASVSSRYSPRGFNHYDNDGDQTIVVMPVYNGGSLNHGKDTITITDSYKNSSTATGSGGSGQNSSDSSSHSSSSSLSPRELKDGEESEGFEGIKKERKDKEFVEDL